jgi:hypothetical protein
VRVALRAAAVLVLLVAVILVLTEAAAHAMTLGMHDLADALGHNRCQVPAGLEHVCAATRS